MSVYALADLHGQKQLWENMKNEVCCFSFRNTSTCDALLIYFTR